MKELSKKSNFWLPKSVYLGLRQYVWSVPYYKKLRDDLLTQPEVKAVSAEHIETIRKNATIGDPTYIKAVELYSYNSIISNYNRAWDYMKRLQIKDEDLKLVKKGIENNCSYDALIATTSVTGITRKEYYALCRYFFWILHKCVIGLA